MHTCVQLGATVEAVHTQGWHAMHGRALCELYNLKEELPAVCSKERVKSIRCAGVERSFCLLTQVDVARPTSRIFNSGVLVLSEMHRPLFEGWEKQSLQCRILCDQLYLNAQLHRHHMCLDDLGTAFNLPGSTIQKLLTSTPKQVG